MSSVLLAPPSDAADLDDLRAAVRAACVNAGGTAAARAVVTSEAPGYDQKLWGVLAGQIGVSGVGLPETAGGAGGLAAVAAVSEELGRLLAPVPFLSSTVLCGQLVAACAGRDGEIPQGETRGRVLAAIAGGEVFALALADAAGWHPEHPPVAAEPDGPGRRLSGRAFYALDGLGAVGLLTAATGPAGVDVVLVDPHAPGIRVTPMRTLDLSRGLASVDFTEAPATPLTSGGHGPAALRTALDLTMVALAAEQLGGAQACLDMTVAYLRERHQFGRPVGSFQAVKHRCADLLVAVETARSAVDRALLARTPAQLSEAAAVAKVWCGEAFTTVAEECLQLSGGIGFSWEHDVHLYLRRARADAAVLGGAAEHRQRLATLLNW